MPTTNPTPTPSSNARTATAVLAAAVLGVAGAPLSPSLRAQAPAAVSPADRHDLEGSSYTHYPLGRHDARVQTLHDDVPGGTLITGHAYRRDAIGVRGTIAGLSCDMQVTLSMSPNTAASASGTFANNVGTGPVVVLPRTFVNFPGTDRPTLDPAPSFELYVPYQTPFLVPAGGGTLCVDVEMFGNTTANGPNQNVSLYLDAHEQFTDGSAVQPGFRTGTGCPAPGNSADSYANLEFWRLGGSSEMDVSIRNGVADSGAGTTGAWLAIGNSLASSAWPTRTDCTFWTSAEILTLLPGTMGTNGRYDDVLPGLPLLPPGYRVWCQVGSFDWATVEMAFSDASTFVTPPSGSLPVPAARIANGSNRSATSGTVSLSVPVMAFF